MAKPGAQEDYFPDGNPEGKSYREIIGEGDLATVDDEALAGLLDALQAIDLAYAGQQGTREQVLANFPGRRVVQLPQSTWFREDENLHRVQRLIAEHGAFTVMLRDEPSLAFAREHLNGAAAISRVPVSTSSSGIGSSVNVPPYTM